MGFKGQLLIVFFFFLMKCIVLLAIRSVFFFGLYKNMLIHLDRLPTRVLVLDMADHDKQEVNKILG
jgi:hypothetical protein